MKDYSDIYDAKRPGHEDDDFYIRHPRMPVTDRAKIFAPFAAIKWDEVVNRARERNLQLAAGDIEHSMESYS